MAVEVAQHLAGDDHAEEVAGEAGMPCQQAEIAFTLAASSLTNAALRCV